MSLPINYLNRDHVEQYPEARDADYVVVGGGPIGLAAALETFQKTGKRGVVIEKYKTYQRKEIRLRLEAGSLAGLARSVAELEKTIPDLQKRCPNLRQKIQSWSKAPVPIAELEGTLAEIVDAVGIPIIRGNAVDPKDLKSLFPQAKFFIGADGSRSEMRKSICQDEFKFNTTHNHIINIHYRVKSKGSDVDPSKLDSTLRKIHQYKSLKFCEHVINENRSQSKDNDGTEIVRLQVFVDQATYDKMSDATFKNPYQFDCDLDKVPPALKEILIRWWGTQDDEIVQDHETNRMTVIALGSYAAKQFYQVEETENGPVTIALAGDAAAAFPFFRAINTALLLLDPFTDAIKRAFENMDKAESIEDATKRNKAKIKAVATAFDSYSTRATLRFYIERIKAFFKSIFLKLSQFWLKASNRSPLASVYIRNESEVRDRGQRAWDILVASANLRKSVPMPDQSPDLIS